MYSTCNLIAADFYKIPIVAKFIVEFNKAIELGKDIIPVLLDGFPLCTSLNDYQFISLSAIRRHRRGPLPVAYKPLASQIIVRIEEILLE